MRVGEVGTLYPRSGAFSFRMVLGETSKRAMALGQRLHLRA